MTDPDTPFFEVALRQRATRELLPDPVPEALIERILEAGTHAPSAMNGQPWHFVVVQDAAVRQQIADGAGRRALHPAEFLDQLLL